MHTCVIKIIDKLAEKRNSRFEKTELLWCKGMDVKLYWIFSLIKNTQNLHEYIMSTSVWFAIHVVKSYYLKSGIFILKKSTNNLFLYRIFTIFILVWVYADLLQRAGIMIYSSIESIAFCCNLEVFHWQSIRSNVLIFMIIVIILCNTLTDCIIY